MSDTDVPSKGDEVDRRVTFSLGRGQHYMSFGRGRPMPSSAYECSVDQSELNPPPVPAAASTPIGNARSDLSQLVSTEALSGVIADLAKQIGDAITTNLSGLNPQSQSQSQVADSHPSDPTDQSQTRFVVQSDIRAPPYFKGDHTDTFSIQEWEGLMRCYLSRIRCVNPVEMCEIITSRLIGKARDVVQVSLRCQPQSCSDKLVSTVFDILKRNFGELIFSSLPMRDFYNILPADGETAMDYWIRLNKSIEAADECLRRRGKQVEDPGAEVVTMFINHCPDPGLALSFQLKPIEEWTAAEVQSRLDNHVASLRKPMVTTNRAVGSSTGPAVLSCLPQLGAQSPSAALPADVAPFAVRYPQAALACDRSSASGPLYQQPQQHVAPQPTPFQNAGLPKPTFSSSSGVEPPHQMAEMFDKVLSLCAASLATKQHGQHMGSYTRGSKRPQHAPCRVCCSEEHTTHSHCRLFRLCLNCFGSGHIKRDCPQPAHQTPQPSSQYPSLN
ncbi:uncharacterized protein LOC106959356 [Poecilia latipinna]|uniref:uncharacterized protein LOC106959356 n=1 Tax=Poecilia latipinna TaxID=48699 RepID=UPI00072EC57C|nr:PREDICTED: uncharacterized protein LOC106959356 [Poecilia latipinna]